MRLSRDQWGELVAHAREEAPNECCGVITLDEGVATEIHRGVNDRASPYGYQLDSRTMLTAFKATEERGLEVAYYHSHPRSPPEPSQQDINLADRAEGLMVIVSLEGEPEVRAWSVEGRKVAEEPVEIA